MGITGLIPFLEKSSRQCNVSEFSGCTVAIDTYCWLHKGAFSCADKIALGQPTDAYVHYCMKYVKMLLSHRIKPILVFDGCRLPAKADTEAKRRENREANKKRAVQLIKMGQNAEGRNLLRRSVDITHEMALEVIKKCHEHNVDCIVAPYEADAQLAYLNTTGIADLVITEDSDLTLFGCKKILFKMDPYGDGILVEQDRLHLAMNMRPENFNIEYFRYMCILSGCDYLASLPGIGLNKACKFVLRTADSDILQAVSRIGSFLNLKTLTVPQEYLEGFVRALITFKHQLVYCPLERKQVRLNPVGREVTAEQLYHAGDEKDEKLAWQLALGNCDPASLKQLYNWDPDCHLQKTKTNSSGKNSASECKSIWSRDFIINRQPLRKIKQEKLSWSNTKGKGATLKEKSSPIKRSFHELDDDLTEPEMRQFYSNKKVQKNEDQDEMESEKIPVSKEEENTPPNSPVKSNPFLKKTPDDGSPCLVRGRRKRLRAIIALQPTVIDVDNAVESKFFSGKNENKNPENLCKTIIPETPDYLLLETQPACAPDKGEPISRFDSGVDVKELFDDQSCDAVDMQDNDNDSAKEKNQSENNDFPVDKINAGININCDINELPQDEITECAKNNQAVNTHTSVFFQQFTNSKPSNRLMAFKSDPLPITKTTNRNSTKFVKKTQLKKKSEQSQSQNLLNMYGFQRTIIPKN